MRQLFTLRIHFSDGSTWTQTGVAYESVAAVKHVWDVVSPHLHVEACGEAINYSRVSSQ